MELWRQLATFCSFGTTYLWRQVFDWDGEGKEKALLEYVLRNAEEGNPQSVLAVIDDYALSGKWFMNIGFIKGRILDSALAERKPKYVLELGTYCGYSAVRIASQLEQPSSKLISLELRPKVAEVARKVIRFAGLSSKVEVLPAPLGDRVQELRASLEDAKMTSFDFVFLDHDKKCYLSDYLLLKDSKLIGPGTVIFTDNLGFPGAPEFWNYLQTGAQELETEYYKTRLEYVDWFRDTVAVSTFRQLPELGP